MSLIRKKFPGVQALDDAGLEVQPGEIHALLGENGAGKSTLIKILAGAQQPDSGTIEFGGARARNVGWRIDYILISAALLPRLRAATILPEVYGSDHCPVAVELGEKLSLRRRGR